LLRPPRARHSTRAARPSRFPILPGSRRAYATVGNQQKILKSNATIISNQKKILRNQERLLLIFDNEIKILRNQEAIIKNQKKILADQAKMRRPK